MCVTMLSSNNSLNNNWSAGNYIAAARVAETVDPAARDLLLADTHLSSRIVSPRDSWLGDIAASIHLGADDPLFHRWR